MVIVPIVCIRVRETAQIIIAHDYKPDVATNILIIMWPARMCKATILKQWIKGLIVGGSLGTLSGVLALILECIVVASCCCAKASSAKFHISK